MSLTGTHHAFASIDEHGVNVVLHAFFTARPRYLHYGSAPFVTANSTTETLISPIAFPGVAGGISYAIDFTIPVVDLYPPNGTLPAPLVLDPGKLSISTTVAITIGCAVPKGNDGRGSVHPVSTKLRVIAIAHPSGVYVSPGVGHITFHVDEVLIPDIEPVTLRAVLDCLLEMTLNAVLSSVQLPFNIIDVDFFKIILEEGPTIADDQIELWGDIS
ncbi:MAG TPA: hypothetical protein VND62_00080 [Acidimicrobiales bacterium]|nr:hypothetical protein [Acidimicrobiales bacterium]